MQAGLPLVKKPFAQMRPKIDRLSEIGCAPCPYTDDATAAVKAQWSVRLGALRVDFSVRSPVPFVREARRQKLAADQVVLTY